MFRNEELRSILFKLLILQVVFALLAFILLNVFMDNINRKILVRDMAMVGGIMKDYPELEDKIIPYISKEASKEEQALGEVLLRDYGYKLDLGKNQQVLLKGVSPNIQIISLILILLALLPLGFLIVVEYKRIYEKVRLVSSSAEKVIEGDFSIYLSEEGEGDFYILNHQINQMANRLENTLDRLNREKVFLKDTIADISHQLKTPLSSLIMLNDLLLDEDDMDEETRIDFLEKSQDQLDRMEWLIINLLKLAKIEAGAIDFKKEKVLLKEAIDLGLASLDLKLKDEEISIEGNMAAYFYGDPDWTSEAIINILKNAGEHSRGLIHIVLEDTPLFSTVRIRDNGPGIDKKDLPHIFKRFYKSTNETKADSIGIGLNLAKLIVEAQEGTISVKSEKNKGTEFILTFLKR